MSAQLRGELGLAEADRPPCANEFRNELAIPLVLETLRVLPRLNLLTEMVGLAPNMFIFCAAMLASALASWRSGKAAAERVGPVFAIVALGAIIAQVNGWHPFSVEREGEYREISDRQDKLIGLWQACVDNDDEESCSETQSQHEQLDQLQRRRKALVH